LLQPAWRVIEAHPRLPATGNVAGLAQRNPETGEVIGASSGIGAGDTMNYGELESKLRHRAGFSFSTKDR
jgi:hypothetical protein